jgi:SAM-dependent methyltransferase
MEISMSRTFRPESDSAYWAAEHYQTVADSLAGISEQLCEFAGLRADERVLDVGTATGNAAIAAARRRCQVTAVDIDSGMLDMARPRAAEERLSIEFVHADAQNLAYPDSSFDAVVSAYGAMFAPDLRRTAGELMRVCGLHGRITVAHWTPDSAITGMFEILHNYHAKIGGIRHIAEHWATAAGLQNLFGPSASIRSQAAHHFVSVASPEEWADIICRTFGPARAAIAAITDRAAARLHGELADLFTAVSHKQNERAHLRMDFLLATITQPGA